MNKYSANYISPMFYALSEHATLRFPNSNSKFSAESRPTTKKNVLIESLVCKSAETKIKYAYPGGTIEASGYLFFKLGLVYFL